MKQNKYEFSCIVCETVHKTSQPKKRLCSKECSDKYWKKQGVLNISTASVGSISEMEVCCEMLKNGYSVFRTVSNSSFCDVIAVKGNECLMIEVRTGYRNMSGVIAFPKNLHSTIAIPTHYGLYLAESNEVIIRKITDEEIKKFSKK